MSRTDNYQLNFIASYAREFGAHNVSGLFTIEKSERESEYVWGNVTLPYSFTNYQSNGASGEQTTVFNRSESGTLAYVGRLNYVYADKYLAEFLIRADAAQWKFCPRKLLGRISFIVVRLGYVGRDWFKDNVKFVDFFKIRGSYGLLGRNNIPDYAWLMTYGNEVVKGPIFGSNPNEKAGPHFQMPSASPNRDAHWDNCYKSNLGFDVKFLNNRCL
jgi:hypothetical protein